jgi:hypothetical protein
MNVVNVEIGTAAAQFPEKEYIHGIAVAVQLFWSPKISTGLFLFNAIPKSRNVVFDFIDVVFGDAFVLRLSLLLCHVAPDKIPHYGLQRRIKMSYFRTDTARK